LYFYDILWLVKLPKVLRIKSKIEACKKRLRAKKELLQQTLIQIVSLQRLLARNQSQKVVNSEAVMLERRLFAPFALVMCQKKSSVEKSIHEDNFVRISSG
jgi:hypothetical protein